jgi:NAD(P)-dependent dehydrogenase (short-subunit alcohol dehydrogenase family)
MSDKPIVLVTGGNTGIGYETVKALYASTTPHIVLMGSRSIERAEAAIKTLESDVPDSKSEIALIQIDIEDDASIKSSYKVVETKYGKLDALVNNAGMYARSIPINLIWVLNLQALHSIQTQKRNLHWESSAKLGTIPTPLT